MEKRQRLFEDDQEFSPEFLKATELKSPEGVISSKSPDGGLLKAFEFKVEEIKKEANEKGITPELEGKVFELKHISDEEKAKDANSPIVKAFNNLETALYLKKEIPKPSGAIQHPEFTAKQLSRDKHQMRSESMKLQRYKKLFEYEERDMAYEHFPHGHMAHHCDQNCPHYKEMEVEEAAPMPVSPQQTAQTAQQIMTSEKQREEDRQKQVAAMSKDPKFQAGYQAAFK